MGSSGQTPISGCGTTQASPPRPQVEAKRDGDGATWPVLVDDQGEGSLQRSAGNGRFAGRMFHRSTRTKVATGGGGQPSRLSVAGQLRHVLRVSFAAWAGLPPRALMQSTRGSTSHPLCVEYLSL